MARLALTPQAILSGYPITPVTANALDITFTAAGASFAEGAGFTMTGAEIVLVRNPTGGALTVTVSSTVDASNRTGDINAYSVGAGKISVLPMFQLTGWVQSDGKLYFAGSSALIEFAVLKLA